MQVLVTSSDTERQTRLATILGECGLRPAMAQSVEETRTILRQGPVHLIFCEDNLSDGDFREVLRLAKTTKPVAQVVVASRCGVLEDYLEAMRLGAFDFVTPPYRSAEIIPIVYSVWKDYCANGGEYDTLLYSGRTLVPQRQGDGVRP